MTARYGLRYGVITKPIATATLVMILIEEGKLHLDDRLARVLPEFDNHGKSAVTIDHLLRHRGVHSG